MNKIFCLLLLSIAVNTVFAKALSGPEVPEKIVKAFQDRYPYVKAIGWNFKNDTYSVKFIEDKNKSTSTFDKNGQWKSTVTTIASTGKLPLALKKAFFKSHFSTWYIETIRKYEFQETTFYEFLLNNGNLLDGDHHDGFLEKYMLRFSTNATLISKTLL